MAVLGAAKRGCGSLVPEILDSLAVYIGLLGDYVLRLWIIHVCAVVVLVSHAHRSH